MKTYLQIGAACLLALVAGTARTACAAEPSAAEKSIGEVGELGENIYDFAKEKAWDKTAEKLTALKKEASSLGAVVKDAGVKAELFKHVAALEKALSAKDQQAAMAESNQITLLAANLMDPYNPKTPTDITRLDFYGRELEIWAAAKDDAKLKESAEALDKTWAKVRPAVIAKGGDAEAKKFDGLIQKTKQAKSPEDFNAVAAPLLDEVDNLESVFTK